MGELMKFINTLITSLMKRDLAPVRKSCYVLHNTMEL